MALSFRKYGAIVIPIDCALFNCHLERKIMEEQFIQPPTVSELTGLTLAALAQLRYRGLGPRFYKPTPKTVLYRRSEVMEWVEASAQTSTSRNARALA